MMTVNLWLKIFLQWTDLMKKSSSSISRRCRIRWMAINIRLAGGVAYQLMSLVIIESLYMFELKIPRLRLRTMISKSLTKYLAFLTLRAVSKMSRLCSRPVASQRESYTAVSYYPRNQRTRSSIHSTSQAYLVIQDIAGDVLLAQTNEC